MIPSLSLAGLGRAGVGLTVPVVWSASDQTDTILSNGNLTAEVGPSTTSGFAAARSTSPRSSRKRQVDFTIDTGLTALFGVAKASAAINGYPGFDNDGVGLYFLNGDVYRNNSVIATAGAALTVGSTYSMVRDFPAGTVAFYDSAGTLLVSVTAFAGDALFAMYGNGSNAGTRQLTIDGTPTSLFASAIAWDS